MTSDILYQQAKKALADETLMGVLADALDEDGNADKAILCRSLREALEFYRETAVGLKNVEYLQYLLGMTDIEVNGFLDTASSGNVFPTADYFRSEGIAITSPDETGTLKVWWYGEWTSMGRGREMRMKAVDRKY